MKTLKTGLFGFFFLAASICQAEYNYHDDRYLDGAYSDPEEYDVVDVTTEIFLLRPLGLVGTFAGAGVFLATLPLSLFASITPPHDAVGKAATVFVTGPANYTFARPFAHYYYDPRGEYELFDDTYGEFENPYGDFEE